jgi:hypothetical protein
MDLEFSRQIFGKYSISVSNKIQPVAASFPLFETLQTRLIMLSNNECFKTAPCNGAQTMTETPVVHSDYTHPNTPSNNYKCKQKIVDIEHCCRYGI